jgi:hypothetical protein
MMSERLLRALAKVAAVCTPDRVRVYPPIVMGLFFAMWIGSYVAMRKTATLDAWGRFLGNDFMAFYTGARLWADGRLVELYDFEAQAAFQASQAGEPIDFVVPFISPPNALLVYAPFAQGSYLVGVLLWWLVGVASVIGACWALRRVAPLDDKLSARQMAAVCVCTMPTLMWLSFGQATGLVMLIWSLSLLLLVRGRDLSAGFVLAMLAFKPQLALGPALIMIAARRWRALAGGVLGLGAWGALSWWLFAPQLSQWFGKTGEIAGLLAADEYARWGVHSFYGFFHLLVGPLSATLANVLSAAASVAAVGCCVRLWWGVRWEPSGGVWRLRAAITLALGSLSGLHLFVYDAMLWLIPLLLVLPELEPSEEAASPYMDGGELVAWTGLLFWALFLSGPLVQAQWAAMQAVGLPALAVQPSTLLLVGWVWSCRRQLGGVEAHREGTA